MSDRTSITLPKNISSLLNYHLDMDNSVTLRTPFKIQKFASIEDFIMTIFPEIESYLKKALSSSNIQRPDLDTIAYSELERKFKVFIIQNYSINLNEYLRKEAKHASSEAMKDVLLSTISTTLNVRDANNNQLSVDDYLISLRNTINNIDL
jgi:hypothetical protein